MQHDQLSIFCLLYSMKVLKNLPSMYQGIVLMMLLASSGILWDQSCWHWHLLLCCVLCYLERVQTSCSREGHGKVL